MSRLTTNIAINLIGNLEATARRYSRSISGMASESQRASGRMRDGNRSAGRSVGELNSRYRILDRTLNRTTSSSQRLARSLTNVANKYNLAAKAGKTLNKGVDAIGNRYTAVASGIVGAAAINGQASMDRRLSRVAIAAKISREQAQDLYGDIEELSLQADLKIDPSEALGAVEEILTKTGDLEYAIDNLPNIAATIQATGATGQEVGGLFTEFKKLGITDQREAMKVIDTLNLQGKSGAFLLSSMARLGPEIFATWSANTGRMGADAAREMGAVMQIVRQGTGTDDKAVTAYSALLRDLIDSGRQSKLSQWGVAVREKDERGALIMRAPHKIMSELMLKVKGDLTKLGALGLTDEATNALKPLADDAKDGSIESFDTFLDVVGDGKTTLADAAIAANDFEGALQVLRTSWNRFSRLQLAEPIAEFSKAISSLPEGKIGEYLEDAKQLAIIFGGVWLTVKAMGAANKVFDFENRFISSGRDGRGMSPGSIAPTPVWVVNWPGSVASRTPPALPGPGGSGGPGSPSGGGGLSRIASTTAMLITGLAAMEAAWIGVQKLADLATPDQKPATGGWWENYLYRVGEEFSGSTVTGSVWEAIKSPFEMPIANDTRCVTFRYTEKGHDHCLIRVDQNTEDRVSHARRRVYHFRLLSG